LLFSYFKYSGGKQLKKVKMPGIYDVVGNAFPIAPFATTHPTLRAMMDALRLGPHAAKMAALTNAAARLLNKMKMDLALSFTG
jgi:hypothetical protein